jgi:hypothetical protein
VRHCSQARGQRRQAAAGPRTQRASRERRIGDGGARCGSSCGLGGGGERAQRQHARRSGGRRGRQKQRCGRAQQRGAQRATHAAPRAAAAAIHRPEDGTRAASDVSNRFCARVSATSCQPHLQRPRHASRPRAVRGAAGPHPARQKRAKQKRRAPSILSPLSLYSAPSWITR